MTRALRPLLAAISTSAALAAETPAYNIRALLVMTPDCAAGRP